MTKLKFLKGNYVFLFSFSFRIQTTEINQQYIGKAYVDLNYNKKKKSLKTIFLTLVTILAMANVHEKC